MNNIIIKGQYTYTIYGEIQTIYFGRMYSLYYAPTAENPVVSGTSYTKKDCSVLIFPFANINSKLLAYNPATSSVEILDLNSDEEFRLLLCESIDVTLGQHIK